MSAQATTESLKLPVVTSRDAPLSAIVSKTISRFYDDAIGSRGAVVRAARCAAQVARQRQQLLKLWWDDHIVEGVLDCLSPRRQETSPQRHERSDG